MVKADLKIIFLPKITDKNAKVVFQFDTFGMIGRGIQLLAPADNACFSYEAEHSIEPNYCVMTCSCVLKEWLKIEKFKQYSPYYMLFSINSATFPWFYVEKYFVEIF